jgi:predicted secreted hydrolase
MRARPLVACLGLLGLLGLVALLAARSGRAGERPGATSGPRVFRAARPGYLFEYPRDHGSHPEFATEWWYVTGHLSAAAPAPPAPTLAPDPSGSTPDLGFQLTFFRSAVRDASRIARGSRFAVTDLHLAHFAITDARSGSFRFSERLSRPGPARAATGDLDVASEDWRLWRSEDRIHLRAAAGFGRLALVLAPRGAPTIHGEAGVHQKGDCGGAGDCASHYASFTRLATSGTAWIGPAAGEDSGLPVAGLAWFDHEFFSGGLGDGRTGWDWTGLHLSDGTDLMAVRLRGPAGAGPACGTLVESEAGRRTPAGPSSPLPGARGTVNLPAGEVRMEPAGSWISPRSGARYPVRMRVERAREDLALDLEPVVEDQELETPGSTRVTYWEGLVRARGRRRARPVSATGYLELTGYAGRAPLPAVPDPAGRFR